MAKLRTRSLPSKLRSFFSVGQAKAARPTMRARKLRVEGLEDRNLLTTTVFLDFGEGFGRDETLLMTVRELRDTITGPDLDSRIPGGAYNANETLQFESLESVIRRQQVNYDQDFVGGTLADYQALRRDVIRLVQRHFEPFDIDVKVAAAGSLEDVRATMNQNAGDPTGQFDSYVFVTGIINRAVFAQVGQEVGILGVASGIDLVDNGFNVTDETVIVNADTFLTGFAPLFLPTPTILLDVGLAQVIAHEAGHTLGLYHSDSILDFNLPNSDIIQEGSVSTTRFDGIAFFPRFPLVRGDIAPTPFVNAYDKLANDPDIGVRPNSPEFVTGTGASDQIRITRTGLSTAQVEVTAHLFPGFNVPYRTYTYSIDTSREILIDGGLEDDRIFIDGELADNVRIRGGRGVDEITIIGNGTTVGSYRPDASTAIAFDSQVSFGGEIRYGQSVIRFEEFEPTSVIRVENFRSFVMQVAGGSNVSFTTVTDPLTTTTETQVTGSANGIFIPGLTFRNIDSFSYKGGAGDDTIVVDATGARATGLRNLTFNTGAGNDSLTIRTSNLTTPDGGRIVYSAGRGIDSLAVEGAGRYILTDDNLTTTVGTTTGRIRLVGLGGEAISLSGSTGNDRFDVRSWVGTGTLFGGDGNDRFELDSNDLDNIGEFTIVAGRGRDTLLLDDREREDDTTYSLTESGVRIASADRFFGGVSYEGNLETVTLIGTTGNDSFLVTPSTFTEFRIAALDPTTPPGDLLAVQPRGTRGLSVEGMVPGDGRVTFTSAHKDIVFTSIERFTEDPSIGIPSGNAGLGVNIVTVAPSAGRDSEPLVQVIDAETGEVRFEFFAYDPSFRGGVRVATGDVNGDGIAEIITAPGPGMPPVVRIFNGTNGALIREFRAFPNSVDQGVEIAVGDVTGDGRIDIVTAPSRGTPQIRVFSASSGSNFRLARSFTAFSSGSGVTLAVGDTNGDGRADIIAAPGPGTPASVRVFNGANGRLLRSFGVLGGNFRGGVSLAAGDADGDGLAEIFVGAGNGGNSRVETYNNRGQLVQTFRAFSGPSRNSPLRLAALDADFDGLVELYVAQGQDGTNRQVRAFDPITGQLVDTFAVSDPSRFNGVFLG